MRAILRTRCGCEREVEVMPEAREVKAPLRVKASEAMYELPIEVRTFRLTGYWSDGKRLYEEV